MSKHIDIDAFIADCEQCNFTDVWQVYFALGHQPGIDIVYCRECIYRDNREKCPMRVFTGDNGFCCCGADMKGEDNGNK